MQVIHVARLRMPLVDVIHVAASPHGLLLVHLGDDGDGVRSWLQQRWPRATLKRGGGLTIEAGRDLRRYLGGGPDPDLPVVLPEDGFAARVWRHLRRIPRGEVRSYARVAKELRNPGASRAVGQACGANPVPLVVPCHRVVATGGALGGFAAGLHVKRALLALEGWEPRA